MIYVWRILERQVPNIADPDEGGVKSKWHIRRGRVCHVPAIKSQASHAVKSLRFKSFAIHGPRLFNVLPANIRNTTECPVDTFKRKLDKFLRSVPDEPQITGYTAMRRADSNSILEMHCHATTAQLVESLEESEHSLDYGGGHPWTP